MDPLSVSASAAGLATVCLQIVSTIKKTIETMKKARQALLDLLSRTERLRLFLERLRSLAQQLTNHSDRLLLDFNENGCYVTVDELRALVDEIASKTASAAARFWTSLQWLSYQSRAGALLTKIRGHEEEISSVLLLIATYKNISFPFTSQLWLT